MEHLVYKPPAAGLRQGPSAPATCWDQGKGAISECWSCKEGACSTDIDCKPAKAKKKKISTGRDKGSSKEGERKDLQSSFLRNMYDIEFGDLRALGICYQP